MTKICKICKKKFEVKYSNTQIVCSFECSFEKVRREQAIRLKTIAKEWKMRKRELKEKTLTTTEVQKLAQIIFNTYIRLRDKVEPCISCGVKNAVSGWDAGHFYSAGRYSYLRFNEDNVHKQCKRPCNLDLHGNFAEYRIRLIEKIGIDRVNELDVNRNKTIKYTKEYLNGVINTYKEKIEEIKKHEQSSSIMLRPLG